MSGSAEFVRRHLCTSAHVKELAARDCADSLAAAAAACAEALRDGGKLLFCGNGGSAADCQHIAAEFTSALNHDRPRAALAAIALTTDTSFLTANANDFGFEHVFERQVEALGKAGDVLVGITTSGNSPNILRAFARARELRLRTILLTGRTGGKALAASDFAIRVPSDDTQHIQEAHLALEHCLCALIEQELFPTGA